MPFMVLYSAHVLIGSLELLILLMLCHTVAEIVQLLTSVLFPAASCSSRLQTPESGRGEVLWGCV